MQTLRLRQLVIAARSLDTADHLRETLGLGAPYADPGVAEFGLENAVFALGDQFLEVIVPTNPAAPAARFLDRSGEGGYMAIFQVPDMAAARTRLDGLGIRRVWNADLPDIAASHLHPADMGGAIVSIDEPRPPESWRWGGPDWQDESVPGGLIGATLTSPDPDALARRWSGALGRTVMPDGRGFETADGPVRVTAGPVDRLTEFHLALDTTHDRHPGQMRLTIGSLDLCW